MSDCVKVCSIRKVENYCSYSRDRPESIILLASAFTNQTVLVILSFSGLVPYPVKNETPVLPDVLTTKKFCL